MGRSQRQKGKRGERLAAQAVTAALGVNARRGVQYKGGADSADIEVAIPGIHWEVKFVEREAVRSWMKQAREECDGMVPVVLHKRSREEWLVTVSMERLYEFVIRMAAAVSETVQALGGEPLPSELPLAVLPPGAEEAAGDARNVPVRRGERKRSDSRGRKRGGGCDA